jgi:glycosyltransferase involved in cell wall biosynthesis
MALPKISVLIPTYNYGRYLKEAIASVLSQDFEDYELIVSDDCSSDNTEEVMASYADNKKVRYYRHAVNLGMVENWNWCLAEARGELIKFVFGDDKISQSDSLGKLHALMETNPSATLGACARLIIDHESKVLTNENNLCKSGKYRGGEIIGKCVLENRNIIGEPTATIFRKEIAGAGFNRNYRQLVDLEFWFQLLEKGDLIYTEEPLCCFRRHSLQQTAINRVNGIAEIENFKIFMDFHQRIPEIKDNLKWWKFKKIYSVRRLLKKTGAIPRELELLEKELSSDISNTQYKMYWIRYKFMNPINKIVKKTMYLARNSD